MSLLSSEPSERIMVLRISLEDPIWIFWFSCCDHKLQESWLFRGDEDDSLLNNRISLPCSQRKWICLPAYKSNLALPLNQDWQNTDTVSTNWIVGKWHIYSLSLPASQMRQISASSAKNVSLLWNWHLCEVTWYKNSWKHIMWCKKGTWKHIMCGWWWRINSPIASIRPSSCKSSRNHTL